MKRQEVYDAWREKKRQVNIREKFIDELMGRINLYEQKKRKPLFDIQPFVELVFSHPIGKAASIAAGVLIGLTRIAFIICSFLKC